MIGLRVHNLDAVDAEQVVSVHKQPERLELNLGDNLLREVVTELGGLELQVRRIVEIERTDLVVVGRCTVVYNRIFGVGIVCSRNEAVVIVLTHYIVSRIVKLERPHTLRVEKDAGVGCSREVEREIESLVSESEADTEHEPRVSRIADECTVVCVDDAVIVQVLVLDVAHCIRTELLLRAVVDFLL